ncbi:MAG: undecaprenyl-diphosphate phosphatase [Clostridia bacterium]|nr:undecaprenyl-diphosphate phosphatase [Clostridia bacterium]
MGILEAIIYGFIQGVAEFLPISSSGHLALAQNFFGTQTENGFAFNVALHLATLISVCVVFRRDVIMLVKSFFTLVKKLFTGRLKQGLDNGERLLLMLCIATLPLIPLKLLGVDDAVESISSFSWIIGVLLIINGLMLVVSDRLKSGEKTVENGGFLRPLGVGIMQGLLGILPGISRSGSTITGGRLCSYSREEAVRFSFLMSIPAILGACVTELPDLFDEGVSSEQLIPIIAGAVTAAVVGFFAIKLLQYLTRNKSFTFFAVYCVIIGVAAVVADVAM